jgi:molybdenum ABC transporter molybdate-binding protein
MIRRLVAALLMLMSAGAWAQEGVRVFAAGSLREAMGAIARAFQAAGGPRVELTFGASGLLRDRLSSGETADVFASANTEHPQALVAAGKATDARAFARNRLCALTQPMVAATPDSLLKVLLDPAVRLAISTPKADPAGDYAWMLFERAERIEAGAFARLAGKASQLVGGPNSAPTPAGRTAYGYLMEQGRADVFLTYCTNAVQARREVPALRSVEIPPALAVEATYGVALLRPEGAGFRDFLLSPAGQAILIEQGFAAAR